MSKEFISEIDKMIKSYVELRRAAAERLIAKINPEDERRLIEITNIIVALKDTKKSAATPPKLVLGTYGQTSK